MKKLTILISMIFFLAIQVKAQEDGGVYFLDEPPSIPIGNVAGFLMHQSLDDAKISIETFMEPLGKSIGTSLNAGWYNTGKPHTFPGFDITVGLHTFFIPSEAKEPFIYETIWVSPDSTTPDVEFESNTIASERDRFYLPYAQGSIGLIHGTELLFRYMPKMTHLDITANYWGLGIKHDFKQHIPVVGALPFDLSFLAAYSNFKSNYHYTEDLDEMNNYNRNLDFDVEAFNCNVILSKKLAFVTAYAGAGYQHSVSNLTFDGYLSYTGSGFNYVQDPPLNLSLGGVNGLKANIGARLKFLLFTVHADYTIAEYNILTIGVGLNSDLGSKIIGGGIEKTTKKDKRKNRD